MYHLGLCMFQLDNLVQVFFYLELIFFEFKCLTFKEFFPDLHQHFNSHAFHPSMYCSSWFLTLFTTSLPLQLVCRIFDIFLSEVILKQKIKLNAFN